MMAIVADKPPMTSATGAEALTGRPAGSPVRLIRPLTACTIRSRAGRLAIGPVCPYPLIEQ